MRDIMVVANQFRIISILKEDIHKDEIFFIIQKHCVILEQNGDGLRIRTKFGMKKQEFKWDLWIEEDDEIFTITLENETRISGPSMVGMLIGGRILMEKIDRDIGIAISERRIAFKSELETEEAEK